MHLPGENVSRSNSFRRKQFILFEMECHNISTYSNVLWECLTAAQTANTAAQENP